MRSPLSAVVASAGAQKTKCGAAGRHVALSSAGDGVSPPTPAGAHVPAPPSALRPRSPLPLPLPEPAAPAGEQGPHIWRSIPSSGPGSDETGMPLPLDRTVAVVTKRAHRRR